jgi:hypothetical protein
LAAILVGSRDQRTQFWKGAIQESFQQNLVDIGSVLSEEKIFFKYHPPFFLICIIGQNLDGPLPKLCPLIPTSNQDGRQAENRKKGG